MTTYRICCRYESGHQRLGGQAKGSTTRLVKRGAWRVTDCWPSVDLLNPVVHQPRVFDGDLGILSVAPRTIGSFADPFKILKEWQAANRLFTRQVG